MSAPNKHGLDYFPHDIDLSNDQKIEYVEAEIGIIGYAMYLKLLEKIYRVGYFLKWNERDSKLFAKHNNIEVNVCINGINVIINEGLFHKDLHEKYSVLTSKSVQKRYIEANSRRKEIKFYKHFALLDCKEIVNVYKNLIIVDINSINVNINPVIVQQSKVKESKYKLKESKVKKKKKSLLSMEKFADDSVEMRLSILLFNLIRERDPNHKKPDFQKWAYLIDLMIRRDNRDPENIERVIKWCQADNIPNNKGFCWANNILSTNKLRAQFGQLFLKMVGNKRPRWQSGIEEWLRMHGEIE